MDSSQQSSTRSLTTKRDNLPPLPDFEEMQSRTLEEIEDPEDEDNAIMRPDHPLMKRVQDALSKQLTDHYTKLNMAFKDKEAAYKLSIKKRESIGVELYAVQEQLAKLQALLEGAEDNFNVIKNLREEAERAKKHYSDQYTKTKQHLSHNAKNLEQHKRELENIYQSVRRVDAYSENLQSKILIAKRSTLKAEDDLSKKENEKKLQDYFVNHLSEQLKNLQERRALYETQLIAQQKETKAAREILQDASTEMEAVNFEKRQLVQQWKSSLIGLEKRDEILRQIESGVSKNEETVSSMECELAGFKRSLSKSQEESEALLMVLSKLENETLFVKKQTMILNDQKDKLLETYQMYTKSLEDTEKELQMLNSDRKSVLLKLSNLQKDLQKISQANQVLETEIEETLLAQLTAEKGALGSKKDGSKLRTIIHEKESIIAIIQNELSKNRLESLSYSEKLDVCKNESRKLQMECEEKLGLIEKYEVEMKRRHDELGKKASELDLLNRKYDQLTVGEKNLESLGPLEASIRNVTAKIKEKEKECAQLSSLWLRTQNELVVIAKTVGELGDEMQDLKMRQAVLSRKKMVVNSAFETEEKEIKDHQSNIRRLQNDMVKINTLLAKHSNFQNKLEENNLELEIEFRSKLKNSELESMRLQSRMTQAQEDRDRALVCLVEAERQIMLWEKKIQLAKETQTALDPNVGATEIREMTLEIHRMKLRFASMGKLQEKMISEMEKAVDRRDSIANKGRLRSKHQGPGSLQKSIAELTKKIKTTLKDIEDCDLDLDAIDRSKQSIEDQIDEATESLKDLEGKETELTAQINEKILETQLGMNEILLHQKHQKRYRDFEMGKYTCIATNESLREEELEYQRERLKKLEILVKSLKNEAEEPHYSHLECVENFLARTFEAVVK